ncbi:Glycosyl-hydrolase 97 C-terminal, oligomerisation [Catalinimonas alkaloidigena]|uniref:Glycosyl-hydrolase 97 C-terminal, oligomerisation n=1 Tax=Catalinimonas alkaloidigena TaxID=1075417 RepID=A0A1G8XGY2_9BACT|nr:glycoside hydrolase family 97 protein [Catalinimonas alkaloidigena]SDJ89010.1 Glycosyl-hydrolase 97 C-terminal, oligomerisation [Catalinimonas alkaloidigena]
MMQRLKSPHAGGIFLLVFLMLWSCAPRTTAPSLWQLTSPDGRLRVQVDLSPVGQLSYRLWKQRQDSEVEILGRSPLGILRADQAFDSLHFVSGGDVTAHDASYQLRHGKRLQNRNHYQEHTLRFENTQGAQLEVVFRAYDDGIAFRYRFPEEDTALYTVQRELTGFKLPDGNAWMQPYDSSTAYAPAYERNYEGPFAVGTPAPLDDGWCFPALFEVNQHWVLLSEANLKQNFFASHLAQQADSGLYTVVPPESDEAFGYANAQAQWQLPWEMPWRVVMVGERLGDVVESNLISHVSDPSVVADPSWVEPGRASWAWWSGYLDHTNDTPEKLKRFIDFAQTMGWEYSLIDAGWDHRPGFDLADMAAYAAAHHVNLLLWYNSGGPTNRVQAGPRDLMYYPEMREKEFQRIAALGVKGVKIDFFGSDKQAFVQLYLDILRDAARHHLLVNFHGSTLPRGWSRTYPHLISMESVKGSEGYIYHADFEQKSPEHNTILPFTRNVVGPMDYTPVALSTQQVPHRTSYGFELALSVVFESGITHFADRPDVYLAQPDAVVAFLKRVPAAWDDTRLVAGYPGAEAIMARRKNDVWYVGGINGESTAKTLSVDLGFLDAGEYALQLIADGATHQQFTVTKRRVTRQSVEEVATLPVGGFVMTITPVAQ